MNLIYINLMDATIITPGANQSVVATSRDKDYDLDPLILHELSAHGRQHGESDANVRESVANVKAFTGKGFCDTADRIFWSNRDLTKTLNAMERNYLDKLHDIELRILKSERRTERGQSEIKLKSAEQYADLKASILDEGYKGREQAANFRIRDLESKMEFLKIKD